MADQVLYRKHRSRSFSEVIGQDHVTGTLAAAVKSGKVAHAYLFVGPRGVGKTSVARILAFDVNKLDYDDSGHVDIIEIDAASNRRIDEIRELRDKIHIAPLSAQFKVYIIDEVHMLTREAFNALLKTLEEPPEHAIFILATTEAHKVPETISSRTQRFVFRPLPSNLMAEHLAKMAKQEGITAEPEALAMIAEHAMGSFRDGISLLDQLASRGDKIDTAGVSRLLGYGSQAIISSLLEAVFSGKTTEVSKQIGQLLAGGAQPGSLAIQLINQVRARHATQVGIELIDQLIEVPVANMPHISLETALLGCALRATPEESDDAKPKSEPTVVAAPEPPVVDKPARTATDEPEAAEPLNKVAAATDIESADVEPIDKQQWIEVLSKVKAINYPLYAVLRMAEAKVNDDLLQLAFSFKFHARRFEDKKFLSLLREVTADIRPNPPEIVVIVSAKAQPSAGEISEELLESESSTKDNDQEVNSIIDAFGGGEVVDL